MRFRRFHGPDAASALRQVKAALGPEAIILATRPQADGGVEITAAVDVDLVTAPLAPAAPEPSADVAVILRELRELGARVRSMDRALQQRCLDVADLDVEARALAERLVAGGLAAHLATQVAATFERCRREGAAAPTAIETSLERHLLGAAPAASRRITAFVGPTGSGKTTTIAKLAAAHVATGHPVPALVMADTYRVGAAEQLGAYARLLGTPVRIARDADELGQALAAFADHPEVFVDTAGLGGDRVERDVLARLLGGAGEPLDVTAVVSAGASERALDTTWAQLAPLAPRRCVVTKVDEGVGLGAACTWLADTGMALAWLGTGQRVPEDLAAAGGGTLARWLGA